MLILWLITAAAGAQPRPPSAALVDSPQECTAMQGTWRQAGNGWQAACEVSWSREDCLRLGGAWTEITKSAAGGRCVAGVSERATAQQCADGRGTWAMTGPRAPYCSFETAPKPRVVQKAADAGQRCDSQKDCIYGCVYEGPPVAQGADVLGRCRASSQASGCYFMVDAGRVAGRICMN